MKSISILGSGWLGSPLAKELSVTHNIKLSTRTKDKQKSLLDVNINTFIVNIDEVTKEIDEFLESDILIINIPSKNINGFEELLKYVLRSDIKRIIFISSTSVIGNDSSPLKVIEELFQNSGKKTTILRFGGLIGYSRNPANFFKNGKIVKNPNAPVNMIHRDDCISILQEIIRQDIFDEVFNCCSPSHPTKKEFYTYCAVSNSLVMPVFDIVDDKATYKIVNTDKLISKLNYHFKHEDLMRVFL